ncbi:N-acetylglucosamine kinase [Streptomyces sp. Ag109_O5-10]|uniref:N-acetylglucosamine kinase n=1 Tax=Streptomyces sp. Ag109_O5-10 TaxID=1855349 RepID=UPI00089858BA|nr:BadF/BadG/BcrA/BcrD ATPase family protein [Streptomyces sp. Ag109_O5-10]SEF16948.1 BadF-type ATPase [Streptomyces sp. Ag109_O5-10]
MKSDANRRDGWVVGIDAGGTRTRAVLADARDGQVRGEGEAGPGNALTVPGPELAAHLAEAVASAVPAAMRGQVLAVAAGFAGAARAPEEERGRVRARAALGAALSRLGIRTGAVEVHSDVEAAFAGAPGRPADGLALVAGTGVVAARIVGRVPAATSGGDGWLLGDDGGGFWIGREATRAALRAVDGRGGPTVLTATVGRALGVAADTLPPAGGGCWAPARRAAYRAGLLPAVLDRPPVRLADLAPLVLEAAADNDLVARGILREAVAHLVLTVHALRPRPGELLVVTGGLTAPDGPLLTPLAARLAGLTIVPVADGRAGAVALARLLTGHRPADTP